MNATVRKGLVIATITLSIISCRQAGSATPTPETPPLSSGIEPVPASTNGTPAQVSTNGTKSTETPDPPPFLDFSPPGEIGLEQGWASIDKRADTAQRAWVEGTVERSDKIVIDTNNVRRFTLELSDLRVDWRERIALRIDGNTSELTKKRWPSITLERTPAGAWVVVK